MYFEIGLRDFVVERGIDATVYTGYILNRALQALLSR